jgi:general secretion pathway protein G
LACIILGARLRLARTGKSPGATQRARVAGLPRPRPIRQEGASRFGFTLLELMVVMTLILILASIAVPSYTTAIRRAKEAVLRDDLYTMRHLIDEYTADKQQPPQALQDLVDAGYMGAVPVDPITGSSDTWKPDVEEVPTSPQQSASGIVDVHSGSDGNSLDGTPYNSW